MVLSYRNPAAGIVSLDEVSLLNLIACGALLYADGIFNVVSTYFTPFSSAVGTTIGTDVLVFKFALNKAFPDACLLCITIC